MKIYLAGPDVFLPNPLEAAKTKQEICSQYGFTGMFPLDNTLDLDKLSLFEAGLAIYKSNAALMDSCDLIVANMTPFRGPSMDVGTAFELGYMAAKGKPVFGYSNDGRIYEDRIVKSSPEKDEKGMSIEPFQMHDNLMLEGSIFVSGGTFKSGEIAQDAYYTDLSLFEEVVKIARDKLL